MPSWSAWRIEVNWAAIGAIGELIGGAAVIATLIYLAIQLRQNTKGIRAQSYYNVVSGKNALYREMASDKELFNILAQGLAADPPLASVTDGPAPDRSPLNSTRSWGSRSCSVSAVPYGPSPSSPQKCSKRLLFVMLNEVTYLGLCAPSLSS